MSTLSVIIPSYNHAEYVGSAVASVLDQTYPDLEVLVIDDASTDDSVRILREIAKSDSRVRFVEHVRNQGISSTLNHGLSLASGDFIAFLDSDDYWEREKIRLQLERRNGKRVAVWSDASMIDASGACNGTFVQSFHDDRYPPHGDLFEGLLTGNLVLLQSVLVERKLLRGMRFDERLTLLSDYVFLLELASRCEFAFVEEPLVSCRLHGNNSTFVRREHYKPDAEIVRESVRARFGDKVAPEVLGRFSSFMDDFARYAE